MGTGSALLFISLDPASTLPSYSTCGSRLSLVVQAPPFSVPVAQVPPLLRLYSPGSYPGPCLLTEAHPLPPHVAKLHPLSSLRPLDHLLTQYHRSLRPAAWSFTDLPVPMLWLLSLLPKTLALITPSAVSIACFSTQVRLSLLSEPSDFPGALFLRWCLFGIIPGSPPPFTSDLLATY